MSLVPMYQNLPVTPYVSCVTIIAKTPGELKAYIVPRVENVIWFISVRYNGNNSIQYIKADASKVTSYVRYIADTFGISTSDIIYDQILNNFSNHIIQSTPWSYDMNINDPLSEGTKLDYSNYQFNTNYNNIFYIDDDIYCFKVNNKWQCYFVYTYYWRESGSGNWLYRFYLCPLTEHSIFQTPLTASYNIKSYLANNNNLSNNNVQVIKIWEFMTFVRQNLITYTKQPIYKEATKINYTDNSYEIVRNILTEDQVKNYAYNQLLNSYGSFYKATETHMNKTLKKMSS